MFPEILSGFVESYVSVYAHIYMYVYIYIFSPAETKLLSLLGQITVTWVALET